jgi:MFS family permease
MSAPKSDVELSRRSPEGFDRAMSATAIVLFSFALGILSVLVPLMAVRAGYTPPEIGLLVAVAALAQIATRLGMGALMRTFPDKWFLVASALMIGGSCVLIALSNVLWVFIVSQLVQGSARALFFTSSQTHAVRTYPSAVNALRNVNLAIGCGALLGPAVAGYLWEISSRLPLLLGAGAGALAVVPAALLIRFPPFAARTSLGEHQRTRLWRRSGVQTACWMNVAAGAWKSVVDSYVPVALSLAGQSATVIGILISTANAAVLLGSAAGGWIRSKGIKPSLVIGVLTTGLGLAAAGPLAPFAVAVGGALAISGIGAGILQTVGPAIAADYVHPEERGDALALTGTYRAVALFLAPFGMAGLVTVAPVTAGVLTAGLLITAPAASAWRRNKYPT